jgi:N-sulfoglucosamine sulfohydrolase
VTAKKIKNGGNMNILYIHTHDTGRYIGPYGYNTQTPNLQKLAEQGTLFRQAYCAGPTCSPSRAALLTGMAPHSAGMFGLAHRGFRLNDYSQHLVQYLNKFDFETVLCGGQHEAKNEETIGYKIITDKLDFEKNDRSIVDIDNSEKAAKYLMEKGKAGGKPFFLSFGMYSTHRPFPKEHKENPNYVMPPFPVADTKESREDTAAFNASVKIADRCVGTVMNALKESGLEDDTFVIFTTDHGIAFPKMKCNLYDTGIGISLIIKYPGNKCVGKALDCLVSHIDIFPTICELLNIEKPNWLQGKSILPILEGKVQSVRNEIYSEVTYHAAYEPMRCIRTERYKLIRYYDSHDSIVPSNIDNGMSKEFLINSGYLNEKHENEMLFDLHIDPVERVNLINDKRYEDVCNELSNSLVSWMEETKDPLLNGRVEKPKGARVNKRSTLSPEDNDFE